MEHLPSEPDGSDPHEDIFKEADRETQERRVPETGEPINDPLADPRALMDEFDDMYVIDPDERL